MADPQWTQQLEQYEQRKQLEDQFEQFQNKLDNLDDAQYEQYENFFHHKHEARSTWIVHPEDPTFTAAKLWNEHRQRLFLPGLHEAIDTMLTTTLSILSNIQLTKEQKQKLFETVEDDPCFSKFEHPDITDWEIRRNLLDANMHMRFVLAYSPTAFIWVRQE
jgi:hypothetical protein